MKQIIIERCSQCPHKATFSPVCCVMPPKDREFITNIYSIPDWCPLEDYKEN